MPNPDIEITGEPGHPDPEIRKIGGGGGGHGLQKFVSALWASVWSKIKEGSRATTLDPPLSMIVLVNVNEGTLLSLITSQLN